MDKAKRECTEALPLLTPTQIPYEQLASWTWTVAQKRHGIRSLSMVMCILVARLTRQQGRASTWSAVAMVTTALGFARIRREWNSAKPAK